MNTRTVDVRQRGYSLTEVLVATAIFTIIMVAALMIYDRSNRVFKTSVEAGDVQQNTRIGFEKLVADVRMTGYDYDRDGIPTTGNSYEQPDEQFEFVGPAAITVRANFDAEAAEAGDTDNGREPAYESTQFPVVTTDNTEIVTYALKSDNGTNSDSIVFYADTRKPRKTYPGGSDEQTVTIPNVDLCLTSGAYNGCQNPPYTLYRITLKDQDLSNPSTAAKFDYTPIASNIRRIQFSYFNDPAGTTAVTPNGGTGVYPASGSITTANAAARDLRGTIQSVRIDLVGMNASSDASYRSPVELGLPAAQQVAAAVTYRQYPLSSLIVPRNIGRRGMEEYTTVPPGAPTVTDVAYGCCGIALVKWSAPPSGIVDGYSIIYDTVSSGAYGSTPVQVGTNLYGYVPGLNPGTNYFFEVVASNSYGSQRSTNFLPAVTGLNPINRTQAEAPQSPTGAADPAGNIIKLTYAAPVNNLTYSGTPPTWSNGDSLAVIPVASEISGYQIYRATFTGFVPVTDGVTLWDSTATPNGAPGVVAPAVDPATGLVNFNDNTPKLNCTQYFYRVRAVEVKCAAAAANNEGNTLALASSPLSAEFTATSVAGAPPATPTGVAIGVGSTCSSDPCSVIINWNKVVTDTATPTPGSIQIANYSIQRLVRNNGVDMPADAASKVSPPISVVDPAPSNPAALMTYTDTPPQPASATITYAYTVRAEQACTPASNSAYSSPPAVFPCSTVTITPGGDIFEGSGTAADPWLTSSDPTVMKATSSINLSTAVAHRTNITGGLPGVAGTDITGTISAKVASFSIPLNGTAGDVWQIDMVTTDVNGCTTTTTRYVTDSPTGCCLAPWKVGAATFDNAIVTSSGTTITITFRNLCGDALNLTSYEVSFDSTSPSRTLQSVTYPALIGVGTVTDTFATAKGSPSTITPLATAKTSIAAESATCNATTHTGCYQIVLTFSRATSTSNLQGFCAHYDRPARGEVNTLCRFAPGPAVTAGTCSP